MSIQVRFFASLREQFGQAGQQIEPLTSTPLTVLQVWQWATGLDTLPDNVLLAVNMDYVQADTPVRDGDEVAFFPPVTGG